MILDELGRGTATFDGAAIAHSVVDHLVKQAKCRALFATHYHDLVRSWSSHYSVQLGHMDCLVRDGGENVVFLYKLAEGCSPKSFGINVARLARLPKRVLERAAEKSAEFEDARWPEWLSSISFRGSGGQAARGRGGVVERDVGVAMPTTARRSRCRGRTSVLRIPLPRPKRSSSRRTSCPHS